MAGSQAKPRSPQTDKRANRNIKHRVRLHPVAPARPRLAGSYKTMQARGPAAINLSRAVIAAARVVEAAVQDAQREAVVVVAGGANC